PSLATALFLISTSSPSCPLFFLLVRPPPPSTLFPYTTLFRSHRRAHRFHQPLDEVLPALRHDHPHPGVLRRPRAGGRPALAHAEDRKSTRLNSSHVAISYAVFCLKKKTGGSLDSETMPYVRSS